MVVFMSFCQLVTEFMFVSEKTIKIFWKWWIVFEPYIWRINSVSSMVSINSYKVQEYINLKRQNKRSAINLSVPRMTIPSYGLA